MLLVHNKKSVQPSRPGIVFLCCTDIVAGHALNLVEMVGFMDAEKYPKLAELLAKLKQRPAFAKIFSPKKEE